MKQVTHIQTLDGQLHDRLDAAHRHAERCYGDALTRLAHLAVRQEKYTAMCEFIDQNLGEFQALTALKADMKLDAPEEE